MNVIGLTGGIGTGKSTVSQYLRDWGFAVIDADKIAREITEPGRPLLAELEKAFGNEIIREDGSLDRKGLAAIVFSDAEKRRVLDQLTHGRILEEIQRGVVLCKEQASAKGIIIDAPLLFETGLDQQCDQVWLVTADQDLRVQRVCVRDGSSPREVRDRIRSQMPDEEKRKRADRVLDNSGSLKQLEARLRQILLEQGFLRQ